MIHRCLMAAATAVGLAARTRIEGRVALYVRTGFWWFATVFARA